MSSSVHNGSSSRDSKDTGPKLVKKSRPVQTSLTKDPCHDTPDSDNPGLVNFQVSLPDIADFQDTFDCSSRSQCCYTD